MNVAIMNASSLHYNKRQIIFASGASTSGRNYGAKVTGGPVCAITRNTGNNISYKGAITVYSGASRALLGCDHNSNIIKCYLQVFLSNVYYALIPVFYIQEVITFRAYSQTTISTSAFFAKAII